MGFLGADVAAPGLEAALAAEMAQNPDADWQQNKASEIAQACKKGSGASGESCSPRATGRSFNEIAGGTLAAWGYEVD